MRRAFVIAGPTAAGKSAAAVTLAEAVDGEVVNADAMQVYSDLTVLTARPSADLLGRVPHHLYGVSPGSDRWSAGRFARTAGEVIDDISQRGRTPVVVGGTGLWLSALVDGLSPMPEIPAAIVAEADARHAAIGSERFGAETRALDPAMARLSPADTQRQLRAWSVHRATGRPLSEWQQAPLERTTEVPFSGIVLSPRREKLHAAAAARFDAMLAAGAVQEVRRLLTRGYEKDAPVMKAVGVPQLAAYLRGTLSIAVATGDAVVATRQLIKRQSTWFRNRFASWPVVEEPVSVTPPRFARL